MKGKLFVSIGIVLLFSSVICSSCRTGYGCPAAEKRSKQFEKDSSGKNTKKGKTKLFK